MCHSPDILAWRLPDRALLRVPKIIHNRFELNLVTPVLNKRFIAEIAPDLFGEERVCGGGVVFVDRLELNDSLLGVTPPHP